MATTKVWMMLIGVMLFVGAFVHVANSVQIDVPICTPPDYPRYGYYGPVQPEYIAGDRIHYYCDVDTWIGGNYERICLDSGDWTGNTPVCDTPMTYKLVNQTSTADPFEENEAENANDGDRSTCSSTERGPGQAWSATFNGPTHLLRVMLYLPRGNVHYDVISIRSDGKEFSCGTANRRNDRLEWVFHNCLEPNNTNIIGIRIRSLSSEPLQLCEVVTHGLTDPTCVDPHVQVENGRLIQTRKTATLVCNKGYRKSRVSELNCIRTGVWERRTLFCDEIIREVEAVEDGRRV